MVQNTWLRQRSGCAPCADPGEALTQSSVLLHTIGFRARGVHRSFFIILLSSFALGSDAAAQTPVPRPAITGVVLDPTEVPVAGAKVILESSGGAAPAILRADPTGSFRFDAVPSGSYTVTVEQRRFQPAASRIRSCTRPPAA